MFSSIRKLSKKNRNSLNACSMVPVFLNVDKYGSKWVSKLEPTAN